MAQGKDTCQICGAEARVRILVGYRRGEPVFGVYCLACSDQLESLKVMGGIDSSRRRLSLGSMLIVGGLVIGMLGVAGDYLGIRGARGFGLYQQFGVAVGALFILVGALLRVDAVGVVGMVVFALAACADLLGLAGTAGIGWKQQSAIVAGSVLIVAGIVLRRRRHGRDPRREDAGGDALSA